MLQRDIFIKEITKKLDKDKNIFFLSADFGAEALDELRERFPENFIHCGISEQAMMDVATGLALEKNKVFVYAMAPFVSLRSIEQTKCGPGLMDLPICIISVGIGLGYADSGPTHYATEDFACFRAINKVSIFTPSDNLTTQILAKQLIEKPIFSYVRLDRHLLKEIDSKIDKEIFKKGFRIIGEVKKNKVAIISHGKMLHRCIEVQKKNPDKFYCIDIFKTKPFPETLFETIKDSKGIVAVDEQGPSGSLSSCIFEGLSSKLSYPKIIPINLPDNFIFENGGRDYLLDRNGLSVESIDKACNKF